MGWRSVAVICEDTKIGIKATMQIIAMKSGGTYTYPETTAGVICPKVRIISGIIAIPSE